MKIITILGCAFCLIMTGTIANAGDPDALIQLDKEWGESWGESQGTETLELLLADDIVALFADGMVGKAQMIEAAASDDSAPVPYVSGDYKVNFLSKDIAVMVHSAGDPEPHLSLHVWQKHDGKWQVAASATVPAEE